jgi:bifunctional non-homologous end joining protein LigD
MLPRVAPILPGKAPGDVEAVFAQPFSYVYEQKLDGFRCVAYVDDKKVELATKRGLSHKGFGNIVKGLLALGFEQAILDGEILCLDSRGRPDFNALMRRSGEVFYFMFDVLYLNGLDIRSLPLLERKETLRQMLRGSKGRLRYNEHYDAQAAAKLAARVKSQDLEGMIAKLRAAPYDPALPRNWVKLKNKDYTQTPGRWKSFV